MVRDIDERIEEAAAEPDLHEKQDCREGNSEYRSRCLSLLMAKLQPRDRILSKRNNSHLQNTPRPFYLESYHSFAGKKARISRRAR